MRFVKNLLWLNCGLFVLFGLGFILIPALLAALITDGAPATGSGLTDMRATYGGMGLGQGIVFGLLAQRPELARLGLRCLVAVMTAIAGARLLGICLDPNPNPQMYVLFSAEAAMAVVAAWALRSK